MKDKFSQDYKRILFEFDRRRREDGERVNEKFGETEGEFFSHMFSNYVLRNVETIFSDDDMNHMKNNPFKAEDLQMVFFVRLGVIDSCLPD